MSGSSGERRKRQTYVAFKLTCMTTITMRDMFMRRQRNMLRKTMICIVTRVTETTMPNIVRGGGCGEGWVLERIKLPRTIASKKFAPIKKGPSQKNQKDQK
jgi:hypothetical protein